MVLHAEKKSVKAWLVRDWAGLGKIADAISRGWLYLPDKTPNKKVILALAREIAEGMTYIHSQDIIHGCLDSFRYRKILCQKPLWKPAKSTESLQDLGIILAPSSNKEGTEVC